MDLINPFEEVVVFGKAYPVAWPPPGATAVTAIVPTGKHVSHANDLHHVRNSGGGGGRATRLERYRGKKRGLRQGPFGKALESIEKGTVPQGLRMAAGAKGVMPLRSPSGGRPAGPLTAALRRNKPVNPSIPTGGKSGLRIR